jgi:hypothetical protein
MGKKAGQHSTANLERRIRWIGAGIDARVPRTYFPAAAAATAFSQKEKEKRSNVTELYKLPPIC